MHLIHQDNSSLVVILGNKSVTDSDSDCLDPHTNLRMTILSPSSILPGLVEICSVVLV